jgi:hypothetical protein
MPRQRGPNDLSRSLTALDMDTTLIAVVELSLSSWLVAGIVPGVERQPLKKLKTDENALLTLPNRWRDEAVRSGHKTEPHAMVRLVARVTGIGIETADLLVHEVLLRNMRDRRAVARYGGLTGSPDRSGGTNREKGMARSPMPVCAAA